MNDDQVMGIILQRDKALVRIAALESAAFHVMLSSFICSCAPYAVLAVWPDAKWYVGVPISMAIGLSIFGIGVMLERTEKKIEDIDPTKYLPDKLRPPDDGEPKP